MNPDDVMVNLAAQRKPRSHRHRWVFALVDHHVMWGVPLGSIACKCGAVKDPAKSRRGKSSARLGKDQERRIEAAYGPTKVGEFNDAIDLLGRDFKWQSKATRGDVPRWVAGMAEWQGIAPHRWITDPIHHMDELHRELYPLLIRSWIRQGVRPVDVIVVRSSDWAALHGPPAAITEFTAMTGAYFLEIHGKDER